MIFETFDKYVELQFEKFDDKIGVNLGSTLVTKMFLSFFPLFKCLMSNRACSFRIRKYFCDSSIFSIFFEFLNDFFRNCPSKKSEPDMSPIFYFSSEIGKSDPHKSNLKVFLLSENFFYIFRNFKVFSTSYKVDFRLDS